MILRRYIVNYAIRLIFSRMGVFDFGMVGITFSNIILSLFVLFSSLFIFKIEYAMLLVVSGTFGVVFSWFTFVGYEIHRYRVSTYIYEKFDQKFGKKNKKINI